MTKRLGEILIQRGVLSSDGLRSGLDACRRHGGRLGTWLVRLGLVSEGALLEALVQQTGCPVATALQLATAPSEVRALVPAAFGRRNLVVAFARQGRNLDVAMASPNDLLVVDEVSKVTGMVPRPHVATEAALTAALAIPAPGADAAPAPPPPGPPRAAAREWRQFWRLESTTTELMRALAAPPVAPPPVEAATFPALGPLGSASQAPSSRDGRVAADALADASHRDQVAAFVLDWLAPDAFRVALFSVHQGRVMGWGARGPASAAQDLQTLILPLDRPSIFLNLIKGMDIHVGPVGGGEGNDLLLHALGPPKPREAVIAPIRVRRKAVAFLWMDQGERTVADVSVANVREVTRVAGLALEILVLRQKLRAGARLTEAVPAV